MLPLNVLQWRTTIAFFLIATLIVVFIAQLIQIEVIPITKTLNYTEEEETLIRSWLGVAFFLGIVFPLVQVVLNWRDRAAVKILGLYLFVLTTQIITEQIFSSLFFPSLVAVIGLIYTPYRIVQLWEAQRWLRRERKVSARRGLIGLLWILLVFWSANLAILFGISLPAIWQVG